MDLLLLLHISVLIFSDFETEWFQTNYLLWAKGIKPVGLLAIFLVSILNINRIGANMAFAKFFIPFILSVLVSLQFAVSFFIGLQKTVSYAILIITIPALVFLLVKQYSLRPFINLWKYGVLALLIGIVLGFLFPDLFQLQGSRLKGVFGNPNGMAIFSLLILMLGFVLRTYSDEFVSKSVWIWINVLVFIVIVLSGSRNGVLSLLLFYSYYFIARKNLATGFLLFSLLMLSYFLIEGNLISIISGLGIEEYFRIQTLEQGSGRAIAWAFAWNKIQNYFFMGGGFGQDENIMRPNYDILTKLGHEGGVHNSYLSLWFDAGLIGMILFFTALIGLIIRSSKFCDLGLPILFTILFNITFESWLVGSLNPFTILFFIILMLISFKGEIEHVIKQNEKG